MICSRKSILVVALCVLVARVAGLHSHLCAHDEGLQSELHSFTHEDIGCEEPKGSEPGPSELELDINDKSLVKTPKLTVDLLAVPPMLAGAAAQLPTDRIQGIAQTPTTDDRRALRPPLRGPPA